MNKESFLALLKDSSKTAAVVDSLEELSEKYPYSQPLRAMLARGSKAGDPIKYQMNVSLAALYAADRSVLKDYVEKGRIVTKKTIKKVVVQHNKPTKPRSQPTRTPIAASPEPTIPTAKKRAELNIKKETPAPTHKVEDIVLLREEVLHNLEELIKNKKAFAAIIDRPQERKKATRTTVKRRTVSKVIKKADTAVKPKTKAQKKNHEPTGASKEQLISRFIEISPSITPNRKFSGTQEDLSVKSVSFNEDLISENLAEIFARQGKIKKAIEIYKKLIWKFPQKKAFFAARIEEFKPN